MHMENRFTVSVPVDQTWAVFLDVEGIVPCMPGAELTEVLDDGFAGSVKIKLGAVTAQFKGTVMLTEVDMEANRMRLHASGREIKGQGNATADVVVQLTATDKGGTEVVIDTDLNISGKIVQYGRGVIVDVSAKLVKQFVDCLEDKLTREGVSTAGS